MKKLLFIAPHLSTGGLPQYLFKKIETIFNDFEIHLIEYSNHSGGVLVVQRDRITNLIPSDRFYSLGENKADVIGLIDKISPDIIHLEEMPEYFMDYDIAKGIYKTDRKYKIFETSHDSSFNPDNKRFFPDRLLLVSNFQMEMLKPLGIPMSLVEYPIEYKERPSREKALAELGLDPEYKHVINVGLFTARKNQAEIFSYAKNMADHKIKFHFIGNQAVNFKNYWEPLMNNKPDNCVVWGERNDVHKFYEAADLFLFTSRGFTNDKETSPLVIREAIGYKVPSLIYNLSVYQNMYDKYDNIKYLSPDGGNEEKILEMLGMKEEPTDLLNKLVIVDIYAVTDEKRNLVRDCIKSVKKLGYPIMGVTHCELPDDIINSMDHFIYDDDNRFNDNHVHSFRWNEGITINQNINKSHEFPIIRSMRLATQEAKKLGYDFFYLTEFDHNYSDGAIKEIKRLEKDLIGSKNLFNFFKPEDAKFGDVQGEFLETCFFFGYVDSFIDIFESYFPQTLEEYNKTFAKRFPNNLEHFFHELFIDKPCSIIDGYVKGYFKDSKINISSFKDTDFKILVREKTNECYLAVVGNNYTVYGYDISFDDELEYSFPMYYNFKVFKLTKDTKIKIDVYLEGVLQETKIIDFTKDKIEEYKQNGSVEIEDEKYAPEIPNKKQIKKMKKRINIEEVYNPDENKIHLKYTGYVDEEYLVSIKDIDSKACIYSAVIGKGNVGQEWWVMPLPKIVIDFYNNPTFGGFLIEYRDSSGNFIDSKEIRIKEIPFYKMEMNISDTEPIFMNYEEFFVQKVYDTVNLENCKTVLDIGANVGLWTKYILSKNAKKVFSFEPNRKAISHLKNTLKDNHNTTVIEKAVYKERATLQFYIDDKNSLTSSLLSNSGHAPSYDVSAITLEDAMDLTGEKKIDLVKIDIEGAEFDIIENLSQDAFDRIDSFLIEFHDFYFDEGMAKVDALEAKLVSAGFKTNRLPAPLKVIHASKVRKTYWLNKEGVISARNIYDFSEDFSWENMNAGRQDGYNHLMKEMHFTFDNYTKGNIYERFDCVVNEGDTVVDIGANVGAFANYAYYKGAGKIYCFEPADTAFECLVRNKPLGAETIKAAVGKTTGIVKITLPSQDDTMSGSSFISNGVSNYAPSVTIDTLFEEKVFDKIDFLKIDCEGAELDVIDGISDENLGKIKKIALEFHANYLTEEDSARIMTRMVEAGFQSFQLFLGDGKLRIYNFWRS